MRSFRWIGALVAVQLTPPPVGAALARDDTSDKVAIGAIVREYIIANREVLVETMQELERKQEPRREGTAKTAIRVYEKELLRAADSPVGGNPDGGVTRARHASLRHRWRVRASRDRRRYAEEADRQRAQETRRCGAIAQRSGLIGARNVSARPQGHGQSAVARLLERLTTRELRTRRCSWRRRRSNTDPSMLGFAGRYESVLVHANVALGCPAADSGKGEQLWKADADLRWQTTLAEGLATLVASLGKLYWGAVAWGCSASETRADGQGANLSLIL